MLWLEKYLVPFCQDSSMADKSALLCVWNFAEVTDKQKLIVSAKLSLILAAAELPSDISQVQSQSVVPVIILCPL